MSRASNSKKSINESNLSGTVSDATTISGVTTRGKKKTAPLPSEDQEKKAMIDQRPSTDQISNPTSNGNNQLKFVSAAKIAAQGVPNIQVIPEISDEELLEMAIKFEKENPQ